MAYDGTIDVVSANEPNLHARVRDSANPVVYWNPQAGAYYIKSTDAAPVLQTTAITDPADTAGAVAAGRALLQADGTDIIP